MKFLKVSLILLFLFLIFAATPAWVGVHYGSHIAWIVLTGFIFAVLIAFFVVHNDKISSIEFYSLKIKLRRKIQEAEDIIGYIRLLAKKISGVSLCLLAKKKRPLSYINFGAVNDFVEDIVNTLKEIGVAAKDIQEVREPWDDTVAGIYINSIMRSLKERNIVANIIEEIEELKKAFDLPDPKVIEGILTDIELNQEEKLLIDEYKYFYENKTVKNIGRFQ